MAGQRPPPPSNAAPSPSLACHSEPTHTTSKTHMPCVRPVYRCKGGKGKGGGAHVGRAATPQHLPADRACSAVRHLGRSGPAVCYAHSTHTAKAPPRGSTSATPPTTRSSGPLLRPGRTWGWSRALGRAPGLALRLSVACCCPAPRPSTLTSTRCGVCLHRAATGWCCGA